MSSFKLYKRRPLGFPEYMLASDNYFNSKWSGARRVKNVVMVMDWLWAPAELPPSYQEVRPCDDEQAQALESALALFDGDGAGRYSPEQARQILFAATSTRLQTDDRTLHSLLQGYSPDSMDTSDAISADSLSYSADCMREVITTGAMSPLQPGRRFVALSLAEAETIRFIMHRTHGAARPRIALRSLPTDFEILDRSGHYRDADEAPTLGGGVAYMNRAAMDSFRFLNCDYYYGADSLSVLLRCMHRTTRYYALTPP